MASIISSSSALTQTSIAAGASVAVALIWLLAPLPYTPIVIPLAFASLAFAASRPLLVCVAFVALSMLRIHEAYPALEVMHLPLLMAALTYFSLIWNACAGSFVPFWSTNLKLLLAFFAIATVGGVLALNPGTALMYWTSTYWKIVVMALAVAWLPRKPEDFQLIGRTIAIGGLAIAGVAIRNKLAGIGLVEGTRVTIGRDIRSVLGDPNDLALLLMMPLCFSLAMAVSPSGVLDRAIGLLSFPPSLLAIIYTQSRGAIFGVMALGVIFGMTFIKSRLLLAGFGAIIALGLYNAMDVADRKSGGAVEAGVDASAQGRLDAWVVAFHGAISHPLLGVGINNFPLFEWFQTGKMLEPHNTWIQVLVETGVPGFAVFATMVGTTFISSLRCLRQLKEARGPPGVQAMALGILASLAGFCVASSFLTQGFTWPIYLIVAINAAVVRVVRADWLRTQASPDLDFNRFKP